ncbi:MAG: FAD-dependent oxidoreductase [Desulfurococcales archaeon]|nr:FAD-dependent oxidoreductase [Desulfurococcales archaeon]
MRDYDVVVIGAGVAGLSVARELSRYDVSVAVVDRREGVGLEMTSTNMTLVCQGGDGLTFRPGTLHAELNVKSIPLWPRLAEELGIGFRRVGGLGLIRNKADFQRFMKAYNRAFRSSTKPGAPYYIPEGSFEPLRFLGRRELRELEPNINPSIEGALYDPNLAVVDPVEYARALAENAKANGVDLYLGAEVKFIERRADHFMVNTDSEVFRAGFIVNAAGIDADRVAEMVPGARNFSYVPLKGVLVDLDEEAGELFRHQAYFLASPLEPHVRAVVPLIHGGLRLGIYLQPSLRSDKSVPSGAVEHDLSVMSDIVPGHDYRSHVARVIVGIMPFTNAETGWHDYIVDIPELVPRWVNIVLGPAGVSASPMLGRRVVELLSLSGLHLEEKRGFNPRARASLGV